MNPGLRSKFDVALTEALDRLGFEKEAPASYRRRGSETTELLRFHLRKVASGFRISGVAGILVEEVAELLEPDSRSSDPPTPTLLSPFHLQHKEPRYSEWSLESEQSVEQVVEEVLTELKEVVLPFLDRFGSVEAIRKALAQERPPVAFVLSPQQQVVTRAALEYVFGSPESALQILEAAAAERENAPAKERRGIEALRARLHGLDARHAPVGE